MRSFEDPSDEAALSRGGSRALEIARAVCTPANLLLAGLMVFGWVALVGWTGAGPNGWQARICTGLDLLPRSCQALQLTDDGGRPDPLATLGRSAS